MKFSTVQKIRGHFLEKLENVKAEGKGWKASCPVPDHGQGRGDRNPSLKIDQAPDRLLIHCHAGCAPERIVEALGLSLGDLYVSNVVPFGREERKKIEREHTPKEAISLEGYATFTGLAQEFLEGLGIREAKRQKRDCLLIPYYSDEDGEPAARRYRFALQRPAEGPDTRFEWRSGNKPVLYGLDQLQKIRDDGRYVVLVEGESDTQILRYQEIHALGVPGAATFKEEWAQPLEDMAAIYLVVEPDGAGSKLADKLCKIFGERLHLITLDEHKDVRDLYLADPNGFKKTFREAFQAAKPFRQLQQEKREEAVADLWEECKNLATS